MNRKEYLKNYQRVWIAKQRAEFFQDKSCVKCGVRENLELDHIDESLKVSHRIWSWSKERRAIELLKCQVLCKECHKQKSTEYKRLIFTKPIEHGTATGYKHKKCRCEACKQAYSIVRKNQYSRTGH